MQEGHLQEWPGGVHQMHLPLHAIEALEDALPYGIERLYWNLIDTKDYRVAYIDEVIRCALWGGGMELEEADRKVRSVAFRSSILSRKHVATMVLSRVLVGKADDPLGKTTGAAAAPETTS